jgi:hypothetical protein
LSVMFLPRAKLHNGSGQRLPITLQHPKDSGQSAAPELLGFMFTVRQLKPLFNGSIYHVILPGQDLSATLVRQTQMHEYNLLAQLT